MKPTVIALVLFVGISVQAGAVNSTPESSAFELNRQTLEAQFGRKLKLSERIILKVVNKRAEKLSNPISNSGKRMAKAAAGGQNKTMAVLGFIFGLTALTIGLFVPFVFILAIPGLILSSIALSRAKKYPEEYGGRGLAFVGVILGSLGAALIFLALISAAIVF